MIRLLSLAVLLAAGVSLADPSAAQTPLGVATAPAPDAIGAGRRTAVTDAVGAASPGVVSINVIEVRQVRVRNPFADFFGGVPSGVYDQQVQGLGSGFVVSADGYIVTNDHVAGNASKITVAFPDGRQLDARLVGSDPETDIALLKVQSPAPLPFLAFDPERDPVVGEWAIALGNPFGLFEAAEPTVTVGVVSAIRRDFPAQTGRTFRDLIQTDAAINSGNSGGPLVNAAGRVIGMNTFIYSQNGGSVGLGFAVPAWRIQRVIEELRATGRVDRSFYTGLNVLRPDAARRLGLDARSGVIVSSVDRNSPADRAGVRPYDIIVSIGGRPVRTNEDVDFVDNRPGDTVELGLVRGGAAVAARVVLGTTAG